MTMRSLPAGGILANLSWSMVPNTLCLSVSMVMADLSMLNFVFWYPGQKEIEEEREEL